jgi:hypothetical protein
MATTRAHEAAATTRQGDLKAHTSDALVGRPSANAC